jgi:outer membrane lipoprotein-sorting protein
MAGAFERTPLLNSTPEVFLKNTSAFFSVAIIVTCISQGICQPDQLIDRIKASYGGSATLVTSFDLHILWKVREREETKHGKIILAPGDRFRIELDASQWVSDGTTLWQYDKATSQVVIRLLAKVDLSMLPSHAISGYLSKYSFRRTAEAGTSVAYEWSADSLPPGAKADASFIRVDVDVKKAVVKKLFVVDKIGNESTYTFRRTSAGSGVPAHSFDFALPKGASVLDESK